MILPLQARLLTTLKDANALSALCGRLDEAGIRYRIKARNRKQPLPPSRGLPLGAGAGLRVRPAPSCGAEHPPIDPDDTRPGMMP